MFLSDIDIKREVEAGNITIRDFDEKRLQPVSYDILLGNKFIVTDLHSTEYIDPSKKLYGKTNDIKVEDDKEFILHPGVSVVGFSKDYFGSDKYLIQVNGKSSLARIGLLVHNSASLVNPGHYLNIALELCNLNTVPIILRPGMEIAQVTCSKLSNPPKQNYKEIGRYHNNQENTIISKKDERK